MGLSLVEIQEVYHITYLMMHGWQLNGKGWWTKAGMSRLTRDPFCEKDVESEEYTLHEAFRAETTS